MLRDFKKLEIWKDAHAFALDIYKNTKTFPQSEQFGIVQQLRRAAVSISSNLGKKLYNFSEGVKKMKPAIPDTHNPLPDNGDTLDM